MIGMLLAYDADGDVIATLDYMVARDADGNVVGHIDFEAHESHGGAMTEVWVVEGARGSKVWPEWLGNQAFEFRVERDGPPGQKRIAALVHKVSGYRRERASIDALVADRRATAGSSPADIRDLVGGPQRPLLLDRTGRTLQRSALEALGIQRTEFPVLRHR